MTVADLRIVRAKLKAQGVVIDSASLRKHRAQGAGSTVYSLKSDRGKLIVHMGKVEGEQKRQKIWEKVAVVSDLLHSFPLIPAASVLLSTDFGGKYFIVQSMLRGQSAGARKEKGFVSDTWRVWSKSLGEDIQKNIARIHKISLPGGGWIMKDPKGLRGAYKNWEKFLDTEIRIWSRNIKRSEENSALAAKLEKYYKKHKARLKIKKSFLVHGDLTSPSNILVAQNKVTGIIDWEFALAGDPAWDFCFNNRYDMDSYFASFDSKLSAEESKCFLERTRLYEPLFLMWVLSMVGAKDPAYIPYRSRLQRLGF